MNESRTVYQALDEAPPVARAIGVGVAFRKEDRAWCPVLQVDEGIWLISVPALAKLAADIADLVEHLAMDPDEEPIQ